MKHWLMALLLLGAVPVFSQGIHAETEERRISRSTFYAELGGPGILFSANLDQRFTSSHVGIGGRAGLGFVTTTNYDGDDYRTRSVVTIPLQVNYIFGKSTSPHTFEVGGGVTIMGKEMMVLGFEENSSVLGSFCFMYRRQPIDGGFSWRIGFTPLLGGGFIQAFGGVSVGYAF